jgi:hypothetical protein
MVLDHLTVNTILDKEEPLRRVEMGESKSSHAKMHEERANQMVQRIIVIVQLVVKDSTAVTWVVI